MQFDEDSVRVKDTSLKYSISFIATGRQSKQSVTIKQPPVLGVIQEVFTFFTFGRIIHAEADRCVQHVEEEEFQPREEAPLHPLVSGTVKWRWRWEEAASQQGRPEWRRGKSTALLKVKTQDLSWGPSGLGSWPFGGFGKPYCKVTIFTTSFRNLSIFSISAISSSCHERLISLPSVLEPGK